MVGHPGAGAGEGLEPIRETVVKGGEKRGHKLGLVHLARAPEHSDQDGPIRRIGAIGHIERGEDIGGLAALFGQIGLLLRFCLLQASFCANNLGPRI